MQHLPLWLCKTTHLYKVVWGKNKSESNFKQSLYYSMVYIMEVTNNSIYKESRVILLSITFVLNNFPSQEQEGFQALLCDKLSITPVATALLVFLKLCV